MRRMYSEQELSKIIKEVFDAEVADGEFDETIADYVDAYLVEHPVDITALEGQTINPARINVANINGETNPSVKPVYYHPIYASLRNSENAEVGRLQMAILDNQSTAYTQETWLAKVKALMDLGAFINVGGYYINPNMSNKYSTAYLMYKDSDANYIVLVFTEANRGEFDLDDIASININDGVNKIN